MADCITNEPGENELPKTSLQPVFTLTCGSDRVAKEAGFSLHAGLSTEAHQRDKLGRLCRYVTRPAVFGEAPGTKPE